ncbi:MAG: hypothetical protein WD077_03915 [Bacteroidia bacterium]
MELITHLKIGRIDNLSDARYGAGVGASYAGFCFELNHPQYLTPEKATAIMAWLEGPKMVGEFDIQDAEEINTLSNLLELDMVQLKDPRPVQMLQKVEKPLIQNLWLDRMSTQEVKDFIEASQDAVEMYLLSFSGSFEQQNKWLEIPANQKLLTELTEDYMILLGFSFNTENLLPILERYTPHGINLQGEPESKPGYKDFEDLIDLVELLEK